MTGNKKTAGRIHEICSGIWLSIATCFMLFLYAPLELLFTNQDEFWFDVYILTPIMFAIFSAACIVSVAVFWALRKLGEKIYRIGLAVYFIAFLPKLLFWPGHTPPETACDGATPDGAPQRIRPSPSPFQQE